MADAGVRQGPTTYANATDNTFYTSTGLTTVIRNFEVANITTVDVKVSLAINATAATAANCFRYQMLIPVGGSWDWSGFRYLASGDTIHVLCDTSSGVTYTLSGITS